MNFVLARRLALSALLPFAVAVFSASSNAEAIPAVTISGGSTLGQPNQSNLSGFYFTPSTDISVTALGIADSFGDGVDFSTPIGLFARDPNDHSSGTLLTSVVLSPGTTLPLEDRFRFQDLAAPVPLAAGMSYEIVALGNVHASEPSIIEAVPTYAPSITGVGYIAIQQWLELSFLPFESTFQSTWFGPNFKFEVGVVPEPSVLSLLALGSGLSLIARARRASPPDGSN